MEDLLRKNAAKVDVELQSDQLAQLITYAELVLKWNRITNLVSCSSAAEFVTNHIVDCLAAVPFIEGPRIVDVGTGAGLPGIVISILRPDCGMTLVEASQRKARFLQQAVIELGLGQITIVAQRIEQWRAPELTNSIVCRGYSSVQKFFDDTRALHHAKCRLVALKGVISDGEISALDLAGGTISVQPLTVPGWDHRHLAVVHCAN